MSDAPVVQQSHLFQILGPDNTVIASVEVQPRHGALYVSNLWTHHEHRRKGLAGRVLHAAVAAYRHERMFLVALAYTDRAMDDAALLRWYARFGFAPVDQAPGLLVRPADRIRGAFSLTVKSQ